MVEISAEERATVEWTEGPATALVSAGKGGVALLLTSWCHQMTVGGKGATSSHGWKMETSLETFLQSFISRMLRRSVFCHSRLDFDVIPDGKGQKGSIAGCYALEKQENLYKAMFVSCCVKMFGRLA